MQWILIILYSLYLGLLPFDNLKELSGDTITKTLGLILIIILVINFLLTKKKKVIINYYNLFVFSIFIIYSLSYFLVFKGTDTKYIRFCFLFILFFLSSQTIINKESFIKICDYTSLIIGIISISSLLLNFNNLYIDRTHYYIWNNMSVDANIYCSTLIFPVLYLTHKLINKESKHKCISIILLTSMIASVLLSGSRGGLIAIVFGLLFLIFTEENSLKTNYKKILYLLLVIFVFYIIIPYLPSNIIERLSFDAVMKDKASSRFEIWDIAFTKFKSRGLLEMMIGSGFLSFKTTLGMNSFSHNLIIQTLIEGGLLMIGILGWFYVKTIRYFKKYENKMMVAYIISVLLMSVSLDVIISRFLWNSFIIISMIININSYYKDNEKIL